MLSGRRARKFVSKGQFFVSGTLQLNGHTLPCDPVVISAAAPLFTGAASQVTTRANTRPPLSEVQKTAPLPRQPAGPAKTLAGCVANVAGTCKRVIFLLPASFEDQPVLENLTLLYLAPAKLSLFLSGDRGGVAREVCPLWLDHAS